MLKAPSADICEIIAKRLGFNKRCSKQFNLSEWYAFFDETADKYIRIKVVQTADGNDNYNFYAGSLFSETNYSQEDIYAVMRSQDNIYVIKIDSSCFDQTKNKKFVLKYNDNDFNIDEFNNEAKVPYLVMTLKNDEQLFIEVKTASSVNATVYGILQRIVQNEKDLDQNAIKDLVGFNSQECFYCGIQQAQINELWKNEKLTKRNRGYKMEIDRKDPNKGYVAGNIVLSCYWCNNAKTDTYTCREFKDHIAVGIRTVWDKRLKKLVSDI